MIYLAAAILGGVIPSGKNDHALARHQIILVSGPIHYDILLPRDPLSTNAFADLSDDGVPIDHPHAKWLVFGWGARAFYTQTGTYSDVSLKAVWRGVTGDASVMRVDVAGQLPENLTTRTLNLSDRQYRRLIAEIQNSFASGPRHPLPLPGFTKTDVFFAAKDRFHIGRTCNVWVGKVLRAAGLRFGIWTPLPLSIRVSHSLYQSE